MQNVDYRYRIARIRYCTYFYVGEKMKLTNEEKCGINFPLSFITFVDYTRNEMTPTVGTKLNYVVENERS